MDSETRLLILKSDLSPEVKEKLLFQQPEPNKQPSWMFGKCIDCGERRSAVSKRCRKCADAHRRLPTSERTADIVSKIDAGMKLQEVGDHYGVSRERIRQIYKKNTGISTNQAREIQHEVDWGLGDCPMCGKKFLKRNSREVYCSKDCLDEFHLYRYFELSVCEQCHLGFMNRIGKSRHHKKFCGKFCQGKWLAENYGADTENTFSALTLYRKQKRIEMATETWKNIKLLEVKGSPVDRNEISKLLGIKNPDNWVSSAIKQGFLKKVLSPHGKNKFVYEIIK